MMISKIKPYKGTLKHPWTRGKNKANRTDANRTVRNASKASLQKCKEGDLDAQWDFCIGVGYWD